MKITILEPHQVRQIIDRQQKPDESFTAAVERLAQTQGIGRRVLFKYLKNGVQVKLPSSASNIVEAHRKISKNP